MNRTTGFPLLLRLAGREMRNGWKGFGVFLACLALGVGAITAVGTLSVSVREGLRRDARKLLGGDLEVRQSYSPVPPAVQRFLEDQGRVSVVVRTRALVRGETGRPALVELKAVDDAYPLYGAVRLRSGRRLAEALAPQGGGFGVVAEESLLARLSVQVGERIRLGDAEFRLADVIVGEPDKAGGFFGLGPRLMIHVEALPRTGILRPGSVVFYHHRLRLDEPGRLPAVKAELKRVFPDAGWRVRDFSSANRRIERILGNLTMYLTLVSLTTLLVGGIGVMGAVRSYLEDRNLAIASMKCLGADRRTVISVYLLQILGLASFGSVVGFGAGWGFARFVSSFLAEQVGVTVAAGFHGLTFLAALAYGILTATVFALWPLSAAGMVSPAGLFRGYVDVSPRRPTWRVVSAILLVLGVLFLLTWTLTENFALTAGFAAGAVLSVALFGVLARWTGWSVARMPRPRNPRLRHALANLHRPGTLTPRVFFSLGLGLTALVAVALVEGNLQKWIRQELPDIAPSYFFLDIRPSQIREFREMVQSLPGITKVDSQPSVRARISKINRVRAERVEVDPEAAWVLRNDRAITYAARMPAGTIITAGEWWPEDYRGSPLVSFDEQIARGFGVGVGDTLTLQILGREVTVRIANLRRIRWGTLGLNNVLILSPGVLDGAPLTYLATAYASPEAEPLLFRAVTGKFQNVVPVYIKDVLEAVGQLIDRIGDAVRGMALITLVTGLMVLVEAIRASLKSRYYDAVVFKVVGATRRDVVLSIGIEFGLQGLATAAIAATLGAAVSYGFVEWVLERPWTFLPLPVLVIAVGGVLVTLVLGLTGVRAVLARKAWPVLRAE